MAKTLLLGDLVSNTAKAWIKTFSTGRFLFVNQPHHNALMSKAPMNNSVPSSPWDQKWKPSAYLCHQSMEANLWAHPRGVETSRQKAELMHLRCQCTWAIRNSMRKKRGANLHLELGMVKLGNLDVCSDDRWGQTIFMMVSPEQGDWRYFTSKVSRDGNGFIRLDPLHARSWLKQRLKGEKPSTWSNQRVPMEKW